MSWIVNIITDLIGSALGEHLLEFWGPVIARMAIIPSIIGTAIFVLIISFVLNKKERRLLLSPLVVSHET